MIRPMVLTVALAVAIAFCFLAATSANAAPLPQQVERAYYSPAYARCLAHTHGVRPREHCTAVEIDIQRAALDRRVATLLDRLNDGARTRFAANEHAWDDRTETQCSVYSRRRGSLNSVKAQDCFLSETISRRAALN